MTTKQSKSSLPQHTGSIPFLFEIGVEELPSSFIQPDVGDDDVCVAPKFVNVFQALLREQRIATENFRVLVTPRRITFVGDIAECQTGGTHEQKGPPLSAAYDKDGNPTKAYTGFINRIATNYGVPEGAVLVDTVDDEKKPYIKATVDLPKKKVSSILPDLLSHYVESVVFPKNMRWNQTGLTFPRPIRWIVAYLGDSLLKGLTVGVLKNGKTSLGHRFLGVKKVALESADVKAYEKALKKAGVILDQVYPEVVQGMREEIIRKDISALCEKHGFDEKRLDPDLIKTISNLVENPFMFVGDFKEEYLSLPQDVLSASMKKHQKVLACYDKKGNIVHHFIAGINGKRPAAAMKQIKRNYENVLESRLRDAQFFYGEDTKTTLDAKVEKLKGIVFLGKLGTVYDKVERLQKYAAKLPDLIESKEYCADIPISELEKAAKLSKADLVTAMVFEFPELQGIMGTRYASFDGHETATAEAIHEHYLPRFKDDVLPNTKMGALLGIFDKIDTLCGAFLIGLEPTGSQDPYALRRAAIGMIRVMKAHAIPLSLSTLLDFGCSLYTDLEQDRRGDVCRSLMAFIEDKIRLVFDESLMSDLDRQLMTAAMRASFDFVPSLEKRVAFLCALAKNNASLLTDVAKVCERTSNIIKNNTEPLYEHIREDLFQEDIERAVYTRFMEVKDTFAQAFEKEDFSTCITVYGESFSDLIHEYFDKIMVNVDDSELRVNRKSLMKCVSELFTRSIADLGIVRV